MTSNVPVRVASSGELANYRTNNQITKMGLSIHRPDVVYTARVNQTFDTLDKIAEITFDGGSGTITDILPNMTVLIGGYSGSREKGVCRVRKSPTSDTLYINETSELFIEDNDYITVIDEFGLWQRDIHTEGTNVFMDYDIAFGSGISGGVIPRVGPIASVIFLDGFGSAAFAPVDPSLSSAYDGATISGYQYYAPGAASTSGMNTSSPSWTYDAAGTYRWTCEITDSAGRITTSHRWVIVEPTSEAFDIVSAPTGDYSAGDWSFTATVYGDSSDIYDRAMCVLYARDYFNDTEGTIGKLSNYDNVVCVGWIDGESISWNSEFSAVTFTVKGAAFWLSRIRAFPFELQDTSTTPANWKQLQEMTVDKALAFILFWTSTITTVMDVFLTDNTTRLKIIAQPSGNLMNQLSAIASNTVFAKPLVNNYGQMFIQRDAQLLSQSDKSSVTVVMDITKADYDENLEIERSPQSKTAMVELGGLSEFDGTTADPVYSRAPGNIGKAFGDYRSYNNYIFIDQDECNRISGCLLAVDNNPYQLLTVEFASSIRLLDITPNQYCTITVPAEDNSRGILLDDVNLIPRRVSYVYDKENSSLRTSVDFELDVTPRDGITYIPPNIEELVTTTEIGEIGEVEFPIEVWFPPNNPIEVNIDCGTEFRINSFSSSWDTNELDGTDPNKLVARCYFPCTIRNSGETDTTSLSLGGRWYGDAKNYYHVYGIKNGSPVITASVTHNENGNTATFSPVTDTVVDGFMITLDSGIGSILDFTVQDIIETGTVAATNDTFVLSTSATIGNYYSLNAWGGPWYAAPGYVGSYAFIAGCGAQITGGTGIGLRFTSSTTTAFSLDVGTLGVEAYSLNSLYGLIIFQATATSIGYVVADGVKADNTGSLGYTLRNVLAEGRRISLGGIKINNVCAA